MKDKYQKLIKLYGFGKIKRQEPLAKYTTFKIGGKADWFYQAKTTTEIIGVVNFCRQEDIPYFLIGGGSNLLVSDNGFRGLIIKIQNSKFKIKNEKIIADAGISLAKLVNLVGEYSLSGLEFATGIPGTLGGAVIGNAGVWQQNIGQTVSKVEVLTEEGKVKWLNNQNCGFSYRRSRFKKTKEVVLEVEINLKRQNKKEVFRLMKSNLEKREGQPQEPSAGCIFVNPKTESAGVLIDRCGLKGRRIGDAQVSLKHANFIVNLGKARAEDVLELIALVQKKVEKKFGIELEKEIVLLGFNGV